MKDGGVKDRLARFIGSYGEEGGTFESLALELYRWQVEQNPDYARVGAGIEPASWKEIPAVPVRLFRDLPLTSFPPDQARIVLRTSGTTGGRGVVRLQDTDLYDLGAKLHAERVVGPIPDRGISLVSHSEDSSLGHMCLDFAPTLLPCFSMEGGVDAGRAIAALRDARQAVFVPGTAFAFAELLRQLDKPVELPEGSLVMVTGGFKGRRLEVGEADIARALRGLFPGARLVGEYGMTELGSQLWSRDLGEPFIPPPWLRLRAVDPWTGEDAPVGLLRFYDLANQQTVLAIETGDLGEILPDGSVRLHGRLAGAPARGCSLSVEEALSGMGSVGVRRMKPAPTEFPRRGGPNDIGDARPPGEGPDPAADPDRVEAVLRALSRLRRRDPFPLAQGLSAPNAEECLGLAINEIRREGLLQELSTPGRRPPDVTVVCAHGVFTSPLEWACLYAAAGMRVRLKAPARDPAFCLALAEVLAQEGLPVSADTSRDLGDPSAVVAFGGDESIEAIRLATPQARHVGFGHRFSLVLCEPRPELAQAIAWEHALYDTRGCMAPAAVLVLGDPRPLEEALRQAMPLAELALPRGRVDPTLGPEWRRRLALARATGSAFEGESWAVLRIPPAHFVPFALPRMVSLYPVQSATEVEQLLSPWRMQLSTLSTDDILRARLAPEQWAGVYGAFHRLTPLGGLQRPPFPRRHDGLPMLGCLLEPSIS